MIDRFVRWLEIFDKSEECEEMHIVAMEQMICSAEDFNDWQKIFYRCQVGTIEERQALLQMATHAKDFGQWLNVYSEADDEDDEVRLVAMRQLMKMADNPADNELLNRKESVIFTRWRIIFEYSPLGGITESLALQKMHARLREIKEANSKKPISAKAKL